MSFDWQDVNKTDEKLIVEKEENGRKIKLVDAIHKIEKATKFLGIYGCDWGIKNIVHTEQKIFSNLILDNMSCVFYAKKLSVEFEITNSTPIVSTENKEIKVNFTYRKAIETDTICKALSRLGFFADIYTGLEDEAVIKAQEEELELVKIIPIEEKNDR
jgi:hydroxylamine reductase (hybrid-cluster protein)